MENRFTGINIYAKDPVSSFAFYNGLGLTVSEEVEPENKWYGASFDLGSATLWIWRDNNDNATPPSGRKIIEIVLTCKDMDESYTALTADGYAVTAPEVMFYGGREMQLTDPDGNHILFLD